MSSHDFSTLSLDMFFLCCILKVLRQTIIVLHVFPMLVGAAVIHELRINT